MSNSTTLGRIVKLILTLGLPYINKLPSPWDKVIIAILSGMAGGASVYFDLPQDLINVLPSISSID